MASDEEGTATSYRVEKPGGLNRAAGKRLRQGAEGAKITDPLALSPSLSPLGGPAGRHRYPFLGTCTGKGGWQVPTRNKNKMVMPLPASCSILARPHGQLRETAPAPPWKLARPRARRRPRGGACTGGHGPPAELPGPEPTATASGYDKGKKERRGTAAKTRKSKDNLHLGGGEDRVSMPIVASPQVWWLKRQLSQMVWLWSSPADAREKRKNEEKRRKKKAGLDLPTSRMGR